ncbi:MAG: sulfatase-like hydrolase/transferase, partial [Myxococcota bacterium]
SEMRRRAERLVARAPHPSFLYLHTMDLHGPYLPPQDLLPEDYRPDDFLSYFSLLRLAGAGSLETSGHESEVLNLQQRYAAELRFTDEELGRLFDRFDAAGLWEESLVWILSDHGESFGEQGFAGHGGRNMTSSVLHVPLVLKPPRSWRLGPGRVEVPVSTVDVLPTTLGLLGLPQPRLRLGTDLTPLLRGGSVDREFTVISQATAGTTRILACFEGHWKLELEIDTGNSRVIRTSLYNLATDPEQRVDLRRAHPTVVAGLQKKIRTFLATENRAFYEKLHEQLDQQTREQLQRLGYVE